MTFSDISANLTSAGLNLTLSNDTQVQECDYYKLIDGYQFSQFDSGIGLVYLSGLVGSDLDLQYRNESVGG